MGTRTPGLCIANAALFQLSYIPLQRAQLLETQRRDERRYRRCSLPRKPPRQLRFTEPLVGRRRRAPSCGPALLVAPQPVTAYSRRLWTDGESNPAPVFARDRTNPLASPYVPAEVHPGVSRHSSTEGEATGTPSPERSNRRERPAFDAAVREEYGSLSRVGSHLHRRVGHCCVLLTWLDSNQHLPP